MVPMTHLAQHIQQTALMDTHEHLYKETQYVNEGPDILQDLFYNGITKDLIVAGASDQAVKKLFPLRKKADPLRTSRWILHFFSQPSRQRW